MYPETIVHPKKKAGGAGMRPQNVIPGRSRSGRTRNLEIPGSMLRIPPE